MNLTKVTNIYHTFLIFFLANKSSSGGISVVNLTLPLLLIKLPIFSIVSPLSLCEPLYVAEIPFKDLASVLCASIPRVHIQIVSS